MEAHDKHWLCPYGCTHAYASGEEFEQHLELQHKVVRTMLASLSVFCARQNPVMDFRPCKLCGQMTTTSGAWFKHVGDHLELLALAAIGGSGASRDSNADSNVCTSSIEDSRGLNTHDTRSATEKTPDLSPYKYVTRGGLGSALVPGLAKTEVPVASKSLMHRRIDTSPHERNELRLGDLGGDPGTIERAEVLFESRSPSDDGLSPGQAAVEQNLEVRVFCITCVTSNHVPAHTEEELTLHS
jgi:hypothetical protein